MRIIQARFVGAWLDVELCPHDRPGIVITGRSNVGKSTLLNRIASRAIARTSRTPGRTRQLIYFEMVPDKLSPFYLIDLPGYGYASGPRAESQRFARAAQALLGDPTRRRAVLQLVDINVPWQESDLDMLAWLLEDQVPFALVFTKLDRAKSGLQSRRMAELRRLLPWREDAAVLPTSGRTNAGIVGVRKWMAGELQRPDRAGESAGFPPESEDETT
jgi:GTP-binding protein